MFFYNEINASKISQYIKNSLKKYISVKTLSNIIHKISIILFLPIKKYESTMFGGFDYLNKSKTVTID